MSKRPWFYKVFFFLWDHLAAVLFPDGPRRDHGDADLYD